MKTRLSMAVLLALGLMVVVVLVVGHDGANPPDDVDWWIEDEFWLRSVSIETSAYKDGSKTVNYSSRRLDTSASDPDYHFGSRRSGFTVDSPGFRATLTDGGVRFTGANLDRGGSLEWRLGTVRVGGAELVPSSDWRTEVNAAQRRLSGGGLSVVEHIRASARGIERSWVLPSRPQEFGDIQIYTSVSGAAVVESTEQGAELESSDGSGYFITAPVLVDSKGQRVPLSAETSETTLSYRVTRELLASLTFPVAIDPVLQHVRSVGTLSGVGVADVMLSVSRGYGVLAYRRDGAEKYDQLLHFDAEPGSDTALDTDGMLVRSGQAECPQPPYSGSGPKPISNETCPARFHGGSSIVAGAEPGEFWIADPWDQSIDEPGGTEPPPSDYLYRLSRVERFYYGTSTIETVIGGETNLGPSPVLGSSYKAIRLANSWLRINFRPTDTIEFKLFEDNSPVGSSSSFSADVFKPFLQIASSPERNDFAISYVSRFAVPRVMFFKRNGQQVSLVRTIELDDEPQLSSGVNAPLIALNNKGRYLVLTRNSDTRTTFRWFNAQGELDDSWSGLNAVIPGLAPLRLDYAATHLASDGMTFLLVSDSPSGTLFTWLDEDGRPDGVEATAVSTGAQRVLAAEAIGPREYAVVSQDTSGVLLNRVRFAIDGDGDGVDGSVDCSESEPYCTMECDVGCRLAECDVDGDGLCFEDDPDDDNDGVLDTQDNCPRTVNPDQADADSDGVGDACEVDFTTDRDGDGIADSADCDLLDPNVYAGATEACDGVDNDCDGTVDEGHRDSDGDGVADCIDGVAAFEVCDDGKDNDGDGVVDEDTSCRPVLCGEIVDEGDNGSTDAYVYYSYYSNGAQVRERRVRSASNPSQILRRDNFEYHPHRSGGAVRRWTVTQGSVISEVQYPRSDGSMVHQIDGNSVVSAFREAVGPDQFNYTVVGPAGESLGVTEVRPTG